MTLLFLANLQILSYICVCIRFLTPDKSLVWIKREPGENPGQFPLL